MEIPGVLLYKVIDFSATKDIAKLEMFSLSIQNKLRANLSSLQYRLRKLGLEAHNNFDA